jgi:hypothetical protein
MMLASLDVWCTGLDQSRNLRCLAFWAFTLIFLIFAVLCLINVGERLDVGLHHGTLGTICIWRRSIVGNMRLKTDYDYLPRRL